MKNNLYILLLSFFSIGAFAQTTAPDFTYNDLNGNSHSLYADYLNQGKTVFISIGAAWNPWDSVWVGSGTMNDFHNSYVGDEAALLFIEADPGTTDSDLSGGGQFFDLVSGNDYPIINAPQEFAELYQVQFYPSIRIICPDGTMYSDNDSMSDVGYGNYQNAEDIATKLFDKCGTQLFNNRNVISATVFLDDNADCIKDAAEDILPDVAVEVTGSNGTITRYTNTLGTSFFAVEEGDYDVSAISPNFMWETCNSPQSLSFPGVGEEEYLDLGLEPSVECTLLSTTVGCAWLRRCFESAIHINFCNEGTVSSENTLLDVVLDEYLEYISADYPLISQNGQTLTFDLGNLDPWECGSIVIIVIPDCEVELGTVQCIQSFIYPTEDCDTGDYHSDEQCSEIVGAYDPNDKRAFPLSGSDDYEILPDATIRYQIRFQNTGTDTAFNIVILDKISENMNLSTFRKISSSHDCYAEINDDRELRFFFDDIMLPDSNVNLIGSNGYVSFTMAMIEGLENGDMITNEADIFFDFNDPIRTNTTRHVVDDGISGIEDLNKYDFRLSPNPAKDFVEIQIQNSELVNTNVQILSIEGKLIIENEMLYATSQIDVSSLNNGIYLVKVSNEEGTETVKKLVIQR